MTDPTKVSDEERAMLVAATKAQAELGAALERTEREIAGDHARALLPLVGAIPDLSPTAIEVVKAAIETVLAAIGI